MVLTDHVKQSIHLVRNIIVGPLELVENCMNRLAPLFSQEDISSLPLLDEVNCVVLKDKVIVHSYKAGDSLCKRK